MIKINSGVVPSIRKIPCLLLVILLAGLPACASVQPEAGHVVIIGVDGLSPPGIRAADTPVMDKICAHGACTHEMRDVLPTKSSPNWASMVTGATPEQHGVTSNKWQRDNRSILPVVTGSEDIFPTLFGLTRKQKPEAVMGLFHEWKGFARLVETSDIDLVETGLDAEGTVESAARFLREKKPDFLFVHLDLVDHAGHEFGHGTPEYIAAVEKADGLIGKLLQAGREAGIELSTSWLVSADHGVVDKGHGGESMDELLVPLLMTGREVRSGVWVTDAVNIYDVGATAAFLLDIELPRAAVGRPVCGALSHSGCGD